MIQLQFICFSFGELQHVELYVKLHVIDWKA